MDIYADEGVTGTSVEKREDFKRMLDDSGRGLINRILVKSISRFARNTAECLEAIRQFRACGTTIFFEKENIDTARMSSELMTALHAAFSQSESESVSGNMRWSYRRRMECGEYIPTSQPFGYRLVEGKIEVHEKEAQVVRAIFNRYLSGAGTTEIAKWLNDLQFCKKWSQRAVSRILRNEKYIGDSLWQKTYQTATLPRKNAVNNGILEEYYVEATHPAIVSREQFNSTQKLLGERNERPAMKANTKIYHPVMCCSCGSVLRKKMVNGTLYLACKHHEADKTACPITQIPEAQVQQAFLRLYYNLKHQGSHILPDLITNLQSIRERKFLWSVDVIELNKQIAELTSQNQLLATLREGGCVDPDIFISKSNKLTEQLRAAKQAKSRILNQDGDDTIPCTQELTTILARGPEMLHDFDGELFGQLIDKVIIKSNASLRFRLKNGLELRESIERTVR